MVTLEQAIKNAYTWGKTKGHIASLAYTGPLMECIQAEGKLDVNGNYYCDSVKSVALYAMCNLSGWKGPEAKESKAAIKAAFGMK